MGKQSSLGPIDPQFRGVPAHGVVEEFQRAYEEIKRDQAKIPVWQPIIAKYTPTFIGECEKAIEWSNEMVRDWLLSGMLKEKPDPETTTDAIINELSDHSLTKAHSRHLSAEKSRSLGLNVVDLEDDDTLQDLVLSVHHACIHTLSSTNEFKIIENHNGIAAIQSAQNVVIKHPSHQYGGE